MNLEAYLKKFDYSLPAALIAQRPASPRDKAKLMVYYRKTGEVKDEIFLNLDKYLPPKAVLILNQTKVIPARLFLYKSTGGKVEMLYLGREGNFIKALLSPGQKKGTKLSLCEKIFFLVVDQKEKTFFLQPNFPQSQLLSLLNRYGQTPLPPYLKNSPLSKRQLKKQYQTVFAKTLNFGSPQQEGAVAAPTASLHFTHRLLKKLKNKGVKIGFLYLQVGWGTFAPLTQEQLTSGKLHAEEFFLPSATVKLINKAKQRSWPVIACGTTVVRALETNSRLLPGWQTTELFIRPGYQFKIIDGLITNFHLPRSSLLMLVSAFAGRKETLQLYQRAVENHYRFYSFGDAMLIL